MDHRESDRYRGGCSLDHGDLASLGEPGSVRRPNITWLRPFFALIHYSRLVHCLVDRRPFVDLTGKNEDKFPVQTEPPQEQRCPVLCPPPPYRGRGAVEIKRSLCFIIFIFYESPSVNFFPNRLGD